MMNTFKKFIEDESGATAIEYGLIAALISVAAVAALNQVGTSLSTMFGNVSTTIDGATGT